MKPLQQHQHEILLNQTTWERKPLLQEIYRQFYQRILQLINPHTPGLIVEIGSGIGNLKNHLPNSLCTDLFPNPWLDLVCDGYQLPFHKHSLSHLILFDVFHHLHAPAAFLREARRVLNPQGRLILFEPYISWASYPVYALFHHEPVAWRHPINLADRPPATQHYYAAQGNATRLFFSPRKTDWLTDWTCFHAQAFSAFSYLLSGGYSKPACYPATALRPLQQLDQHLSRWPRLFGARCLVGLHPHPHTPPPENHRAPTPGPATIPPQAS